MDQRPTTTTSDLMNRIRKTRTLHSFLERNSVHLVQPDFVELVNRFCDERGLVREHIIRRSNIENAFGHQIFRGTRHPSRDKVLQLCFGFPLGVDDAQHLLLSAGKRQLHPKIKRDTAILFCLNRGVHLTDAQQILDDLSMPLLGDERE